MAQNKVVSATLIELTADEGCWLYNESELGRNFVKAVTLGKDEPRSHWVECTDQEKRQYEEEQERLLGKDTDMADGSINNPIIFNLGDSVEVGKWYIDETYGLVECIASGTPTTDAEMAEYFDLPPM